MAEQQLDLFNSEPRQKVRAATPSAKSLTLAAKKPKRLHLGTSSWYFPGWRDLVFKDLYKARELARHGLEAYARHPLFNAVGIDRTYYAPIPAETFQAYARAVPADFRFSVKAHDHCTQAYFPQGSRDKKRAGTLNERFLDPHYASDVVVNPAIEGLGKKLGALVFQFPPQNIRAFEGAEKFADRLFDFLDRLPAGPHYAIEVRNPELLTRAYGEALHASNTSHCINVHPNMIEVDQQRDQGLHRLGPGLVIRWMLRRNRGYQQALDKYGIFDAMAEPDPRTRTMLVDLCQQELGDTERPIILTVNNKAEGCSPLSILAFAEQLLASDNSQMDGSYLETIP